MPEPDLLVVPLGSGGTAAGLLAGLAVSGVRTRVLAVTVAEPPWLVERMTPSLARRCAPSAPVANTLGRLEQERGYLGAGYAHPTPAGAAAIKVGSRAAIGLDHTYTAKAFAATRDRVAAGRESTILYWHTLSSAPMAPLLAEAPDEKSIDLRLRKLIVPEQPSV